MTATGLFSRSKMVFELYHSRRESRLAIWFGVLAIFAVLSVAFFPLNIIGGLGMLLLWGGILRSILLPSKRESNGFGIILLNLLVESFGLAVATLAPLAFILPAIMSGVDYWLFVLLGCLVFAIIDVIRISESTRNPDIDRTQTENGREKTNWIVMAIPIITSVVFGVLFYYKVTYLSFDEITFFIKDVALHISIIQSMSHGYWPIPDLLEVGATINNNPPMMTLGFAFSGVLMSLTHLGSQGDIFLIFVNALFRGYILLTFIWFLRNFVSRIPSWLMLVGGFSFAFGTDIAALLDTIGIYPWSQYQGIPFPRTLIDGQVSGVSVSSLGTDSLFLAFHHLPAVIVFMFIIGILMKIRNIRTKYALVVPMLIIMPFFHLGIGLMLAAPFVVVILIQLIRKLIPKVEKKHVLVLTKLLAVGAIAGLFLIRDYTSSIIILIPRVRFWEVIPAFVAYLGIFAFLLPIGYFQLHRAELSLPNLILISGTEVLGIMMLFFSTARELHTGYVTADYYPLMAFQAVAIITASVGLISRGFPKINIPQRIPTSRFKMDSKIIKIGAIVFTLLVTGSTMAMFWNANYGVFHLSHYGNVPLATSEEHQAFSWLSENSVPTDVVLIHPLNWEICPIIGNQIISSGYRLDESNDFYQDVIMMYNSTTLTPVLDLFEQHNVRYVFISELERTDFPDGVLKFYSSSSFLSVYSQDGIDIFELQAS